MYQYLEKNKIAFVKKCNLQPKPINVLCNLYSFWQTHVKASDIIMTIIIVIINCKWHDMTDKKMDEMTYRGEEQIASSASEWFFRIATSSML